MTTMPDALRQVPYFAALDATLIKDLAGLVRERNYMAGEVVLLEGDPCEGLYFVMNGRVKVFKVSAEGKEQVLRILGPGRTSPTSRSSTAGRTPAASPPWSRATSAFSQRPRS
jgi:CRP/FNR family transcriptional regulator